MKRYEEYKESGFEWIGEIPKEWDLLNFNRICQLQQGLQIPISKRLYEPLKGCFEYITTKSIHNPDDPRQYVLNPQESVICHKNEVLLGRTGNTGEVVTNVEGVFHNNFFKIDFNSKKIHKDYLIFYLKAVHIQEQIMLVAGTTTIPDLNHGDFLSLPLTIPKSITEQTTIANFLDYKTRQVDAIIKKKEELIKKLKEQRQAIINEAVTKGLNPNAKMKDSGIEWLGEIPEHWKVAKLGLYTEIVRGASPRPAGDSRFFGSNFMPWITVKEVTNAKGKFIVTTDEFLTEEGSKQSRIIFPETLLISNSGATLGVPRISKIKGCINDGSVAFISFNKKLNRDFLYWFFITHTKIYRDEMAGSGQPNLNTDIIKSTFIPLPPIEEQSNIIKYIEEGIEKQADVISKSVSLIEKLKQYRQSLISEAVTGKIDVRDWTKPN